MEETQVRFLGWEDALEKGMATYSSIHAWEILWPEGPGRLQFIESQRVEHNWSNFAHTWRIWSLTNISMFPKCAWSPKVQTDSQTFSLGGAGSVGQGQGPGICTLNVSQVTLVGQVWGTLNRRKLQGASQLNCNSKADSYYILPTKHCWMFSSVCLPWNNLSRSVIITLCWRGMKLSKVTWGDTAHKYWTQVLEVKSPCSVPGCLSLYTPDKHQNRVPSLLYCTRESLVEVVLQRFEIGLGTQGHKIHSSSFYKMFC